MTFPQVPVSWALDTEAKCLMAFKMGHIKLLLHCPLEGTPRTATLRRIATDKWFVSTARKRETAPLPRSWE